MSSLLDALRACEPMLPEPFRTAHARLFAEEDHLPRLAACLLAFFRDGVPAELPPPHFAAECTPPLAGAFTFFRAALADWNASPDSSSVPQRLADALLAADCNNVLLLLGQRRTSASISDARAIPPPRARVLAAAERAHAGEQLTVAARALSKHVHRSPEAFWGQVSGPVAVKNDAARRLLQQILDNATWWNVFGHFQHEFVFEVRVPTGHGARWGQFGETFIGFLEPFAEQRCPSLRMSLP